jgi:hypothetical protein
MKKSSYKRKASSEPRTLHPPDERACSYMVLLPHGFVQQPFKNFE